MVTITRYSKERGELWNDFVSKSKNGVFLFDRNYMDYHADRFIDNSIIVFDDGEKPLSLFPANRKEDMIVSHGGLTFGGFIIDYEIRAPLMLKMMEMLFSQFKSEGVKKVIYKAIPHIYHTIPAEEDLYALFKFNARIIRRDVSSTIPMEDRIRFTKERRWSIRKAQSNNIKIMKSQDIDTFMTIEKEVLKERHDTKPVHTADEMKLLESRFPENIKLFSAEKDGEMLGGVMIYESKNVAHSQYIASTEEGRKICAVDAIIDHLLNNVYAKKRYFDFGISTEEEGRYLNIGLSEYKSSFGARATVYDTYEIIL
jgi:hypothetical protein